MRHLLLLCCLLMTSLLADSAAPDPPTPYAAQWKKIDALLAKDQTATAAPLVEKLYQQARQENNTPAYVRALLYKVRLLENKENDADEKTIALLEKDLKTASFPARPILHSLLASLYTTYYNQHRYLLYRRTQGAAPTADAATPGQADGGTSLATWDAGRLGATIVRHYYASVEDSPQRQLQTPLASLGDLALGGDAEGRALRPSLYDLLAHRAIAGLSNQELTITKPGQTFDLAAYPAVQLFGPAAEFADLRLLAPADDSLNAQVHVLHLLQHLTGQRLKQPENRAALADVDLQRLAYLHGLTKDTDQDAAYEPALAREAATFKDLPISTEFVARQAQARHEAHDEVAAVRLTREAEAQFPKSRGAGQGRALRAGIEAPELAFTAADLVVPGQPWRIDLTYRNVTGLHGWAYHLTQEQARQFDELGDYQKPFAVRYARFLKQKPVAMWAQPLPAHPVDYKEQQLAAAGPALPVGYYLVVLSSQASDPATPQVGAATAYAVLGASHLTVLSRPDLNAGGSSLLLLNRQSGQLLVGAQAQARYSYYDRAKRRDEERLGEVLTAGADGRVTLAAPRPDTNNGRERLTGVRVWQGRDTLAQDLNGYYRNRPQAPEMRRQLFLFTDRAIYRPGQTLYFKGILTVAQGAKASLVTNEPVSVRLVDVNGQTVQTLSFTTSDYGSFHGSLVLPTGLLTGSMSLQGDNGSASFSVEEYKRPTFLVQLDSVPGRPQLGQPLAVTGRARAYAGQATDGATVQYRVTRRELWPLFLGYDYGGYGGRGGRGIYPPGGGRESREIAHGTATTDAEGRFTFTFTPPLAPPTGGRRGWEPGYYFEVSADVTDAAGETRSATRGIVIGRNPVNLTLNGPDQLDQRHLPAVTLLATNATGEALPAAGTLRLLARRFQPGPAGVPGPVPDDEAHELPGEVLKTQPFDTKNGAALDVAALLAGVPTGRYRLEAQAAAPDTASRAHLDFVLYDAEAATLPFATPDWFVAPPDTTAPGQPVTLLLGSSETDARVLLEVERGGQLLRQEWLTLQAGEQRRVRVESGPATTTGGPLYVHTTQVRDNHLYRHDATVRVAEAPQSLRLSIATFRDRLQPGQRETWRITIHQANGKPAAAELLATLYDQSLDIFRPHDFPALSFYEGYAAASFNWSGEFNTVDSELLTAPIDNGGPANVDYPELNEWGVTAVAEEYRGVRYGGGGPGTVMRSMARAAGAPAPPPPAAPMAMAAKMNQNEDSAGSSLNEVVVAGAPGATGSVTLRDTRTPPTPAPDLSTVAARSDFRETALWEPALHTDAQGDVVLEFQMPEAVTRWQLLALAHDKSLRSGQLARQLVTQKEVQISPNAPRFFRQGDSFTFPAKFSNLTDAPVSGTAQLFLTDAATGQDITSQLLHGPAQQPVQALAHQSQAVGWQLALPADFAPVAVTYKVVVSCSLPVVSEKGKSKKGKKALTTDNEQLTTKTTYSDGEENTLPVLPNRVLVTESLPLPIVGPGTREFELKKLTSTSSPTRQNYALTLEVTSNPAWYAVQSLPYLIEYPYECSEQVFSRLYANLLAAHLLAGNPRLRTVLAEWTRQAQSGTAQQREQLASKLAQNQDLKNLLLQETPWVRDAQSETERLTRLSTLLDTVRLHSETTRALAKLHAMQLPDGAFPWFDKMPADRYITQLIVAGFGKLHKLGAFDASQDAAARDMLQQALAYQDNALARDYAELRKLKGVKLAEDHLDDTQLQALYGRSFWPQLDVAASATSAYAYYRGQAGTYWPGRTRYLQALAALALYRHDTKSVPARAIMQALSENALHSPDLGMYWKDVQPGYYWREAPTETQATLIEAFSEINQDQKAVDELKLWLLTQKQTQNWESTRATADACYALLLRGSNWLAPSQPLQVTVGGEPVALPPGQAGTGYARTSWPAAAIKPAQGKVTITKPDAGVAWGALYWQYYEDIDKVTPAASPLSLERQLYRETATATGPKLEQLTPGAPLRVGDALVVRLVLRTDRALEYVHLKDQRAAGLEPINQLSGYRYQGGLGYYEAPRDAATNFFLSAVPRGTHVFEYRLRAAQAGDFSGGLSQVQCLYAPEFAATSAGQRLVVK